ncbi:MAG: hypothetical protein VXW04_00950, partial [Bacteroidota bacterium]|nr:hypothetical protein [Bacteroidota bacterium]
KFDMLMANYQGRLKGRQEWEKALKIIALKYPESPEAIKAQEMVQQIKGTDSLEKNNNIYLNYKWIFTFKVKDKVSLKKIKSKLQEAIEQTPDTRWFLSEDRFDQDQTYLVLHGIRNRKKLNEWKKRFDEGEQEITNTNNFVVLSADYKKMFLDKIHLNNEK